MGIPKIEWRWNDKGDLPEDPYDGKFWDVENNVEVMPQEVANSNIAMATRLNIIDTAITAVANIVQATSAALGYQVSPTGRTLQIAEDMRQYIQERYSTVPPYAYDRGLQIPVERVAPGPNQRMCALCKHYERRHRIPSGHGGERFPLRVLHCDECPDGSCIDRNGVNILRGIL